MSHTIVKSITIKNNKVFFNSASSNVYPRTFDTVEVSEYSKLYQEQGLKALLTDIAKEVWDGNYHLKEMSNISKFLKTGYKLLCNAKPQLANFLDRDHAAEFIGNYAFQHLCRNPNYGYDEMMSELDQLDKLRNDKDAVIEICKKNPVAFDYAGWTVTQDREAAMEHIQNNSGKLSFSFPKHFTNDKELAMMALPQNGCILRQLSPYLLADKEIIRLAFDSSLAGRQFFEHLPDLIPIDLRHDKAFMQEIISICPELHVFRAKDIVSDLDTAKVYAAKGKYILANLNSIPREHLQNPDFKAIILERFGGEGHLENLQRKYEELGLAPPMPRKSTLEDQISSASARQTQNISSTPAQEKDVKSR